jgi:hypothetical protein
MAGQRGSKGSRLAARDKQQRERRRSGRLSCAPDRQLEADRAPPCDVLHYTHNPGTRTRDGKQEVARCSTRTASS